MVLLLPLLSQCEGRGKKQRGHTNLVCSANQKWLTKHKTAPIQREREMVPLQSSKITVLPKWPLQSSKITVFPKWQQHETQEVARAYAGITRQSHELEFLQQSESEGKTWAPMVIAVTVTLLTKFTHFLKTLFLNKMYSNPFLSSHY